jgi:hypothetical protein
MQVSVGSGPYHDYSKGRHYAKRYLVRSKE